VRLGLVEAAAATERRAGDVDLHMPQPDAGRALAGEADAANRLAVFTDAVIVLGRLAAALAG
jgi:hypothetical protein